MLRPLFQLYEAAKSAESDKPKQEDPERNLSSELENCQRCQSVDVTKVVSLWEFQFILNDNSLARNFRWSSTVLGHWCESPRIPQKTKALRVKGDPLKPVMVIWNVMHHGCIPARLACLVPLNCLMNLTG